MPGAWSGRSQRWPGLRSSGSTGTNRGLPCFFLAMRAPLRLAAIMARGRTRYHARDHRPEEIAMRPFRLPVIAAILLAAFAAHGEGAAEKKNMELVGFQDLSGRSAYQPVVHRQGERWIAYIGHHGGKARNPVTGADEDNGTSIVDVTDPRAPKLIAHIPGEPGNGETGGAQMVRVCDGAALPKADKSKVYLLRPFGNKAHEIWDVTDPAKPQLVTTIVKVKGTHKSWWECDTGIA